MNPAAVHVLVECCSGILLAIIVNIGKVIGIVNSYTLPMTGAAQFLLALVQSASGETSLLSFGSVLPASAVRNDLLADFHTVYGVGGIRGQFCHMVGTSFLDILIEILLTVLGPLGLCCSRVHTCRLFKLQQNDIGGFKYGRYGFEFVKETIAGQFLQQELKLHLQITDRFAAILCIGE